jgi:hypothetical protein
MLPDLRKMAAILREFKRRGQDVAVQSLTAEQQYREAVGLTRVLERHGEDASRFTSALEQVREVAGFRPADQEPTAN